MKNQRKTNTRIEKKAGEAEIKAPLVAQSTVVKTSFFRPHFQNTSRRVSQTDPRASYADL